MNRTYYTVYKITCLVNGKYYVGCHKTDNLDDGYMGSGVLITRLVKKYGLQSFTKEYLAIFDNPNDMFEMESQIVNEEFLVNESTLNLALGGNGGWMTVNSTLTHEDRQKISKTGNDAFGKKLKSDSYAMKLHKENFKLCQRGFQEKLDSGWRVSGFTGKHHSEEHKEHMRKVMSQKQSGEKNSQHGTCWMYSLIESKNKKVQRKDVDEWLSQGWQLGRKNFSQAQ